MFYGERGTVCVRFSPQLRPYQLPDAFVSVPSCVRVWEQTRSCLLPDALKTIGNVARRQPPPSLGLPLCPMQRPRFPRQFLPRFRLSIKIKAKKS